MHFGSAYMIPEIYKPCHWLQICQWFLLRLITVREAIKMESQSEVHLVVMKPSPGPAANGADHMGRRMSERAIDTHW